MVALILTSKRPANFPKCNSLHIMSKPDWGENWQEMQSKPKLNDLRFSGYERYFSD